MSEDRINRFTPLLLQKRLENLHREERERERGDGRESDESGEGEERSREREREGKEAGDKNGVIRVELRELEMSIF